MAVPITKVMLGPLLAIGLILATITASSAQCAGGPLFTSCACPWGTHEAGTNGVKSSSVGCGYPCPMCTQDAPPQPRQQPSEVPPDVAGKPQSKAKTANKAVRTFRTQRGLSFVEKRDKSYSSETPEACAADCTKSPTCGRATFWFNSNRCFLFTRGARTEAWGFQDKNAISFSFE